MEANKGDSMKHKLILWISTAFLVVATVWMLGELARAEENIMVAGLTSTTKQVVTASPGTGGASGGGGACTTSTDSALFTKDTTTNSGSNNNTYIASKVTLSSTDDVTELIWYMCQSYTSGDFIASLWSHDAVNDFPELEIAGTSKTIAKNTVSSCTTYSNTTFTLAATKTDIGATTVWLVVKSDSGSGDMQVPYKASTGDRVCSTNDDPPADGWSCTNDYTYGFTVNGCH